MRIKWNRHLDGSSSRRQEGETEAQESEAKKREQSSSPGIFRIFRRKKSCKRGDDASRADGDNGVDPPLHSEADEDDCTSVSSIATCASQPASEAFHRDRASSLFSSFRLSLPGSKRKKRRIAPTPSETLFNGQKNEPQTERYSTPDLRKQSDKLEAPSTTQVSLSTSSPSIRHPPKTSSTSAQSLDVQNPESLRSVSCKSAKLSKSVSFSDDLADALHSRCDNKTLRTVSSVVMVEEDSGALESELPACMSDNLRMSREHQFTAVEDSPSSSVNTSRQSSDEAKITKTEGLSSGRIIQDIGNILNDIASEILCYEESNGSGDDSSLVASSVTCNSIKCPDGRDNEAVIDPQNNERCAVHVNLKKSLGKQRIETGADESPSYPQRFDDGWKRPLLHSERNGAIDDVKPNVDKPSSTQVPHVNVLSPRLSVLPAAKDVPKSNSCDTEQNHEDGILDIVCEDVLGSDIEIAQSGNASVEKESAIIRNKHVLCDMKIYENGTLVSKTNVAENSKSSTATDMLKTSLNVSDKFESEAKQSDVPVSESCADNEALNFSLNTVPPASACILNLEPRINPEQKVLENEAPARSCRSFRTDTEVPEFELSLLEFEEVCSRYMSRSNPDCSSIIPLYCNSPKRKSVLDLNFSFIYPNFLENGGSETHLPNTGLDVSLRHTELIEQNLKTDEDPNLEISCQSVTEKLDFPLPPKQWINYQKTIENVSTRDMCTDGVQCTTARGKNVCQELCLRALPTTVMLDDSNLGVIDTPHQSSTLQAFENKSGREEPISIVTAEKQRPSDDRAPPTDMISNVGRTISTLNGILDYSYASETPSKASVYFDPKIRRTYCGPRAICDPLVYSTEISKGLESLGTESYLTDHNFCGVRNVGLCEVINGVTCDYLQGGIEISNPYEEGVFILPQDTPQRNFMSTSLPNDSLLRNSRAYVHAFENRNPEIFRSKDILERDSNEKLPEKEKSTAVSSILENSRENRLTYTEQKNLINKTKSSMIPCRKKGSSDIESKRIETKLKSKKNNSLPRLIKNESHLLDKNSSSHRVLSNSYKDSDVGQNRGKPRDSSLDKPNGNRSVIPPLTEAVGNATELDCNSPCAIWEPLGVTQENKASKVYSSLSPDFVRCASNSSFVATVIEQTNGSTAGTSLASVSPNRESGEKFASPSKSVRNVDGNIPECAVCVNEIDDVKFWALNERDHVSPGSRYCLKHSECLQHQFRCSSLTTSGVRETSLASSKESLNSQLTNSSNRGKSRIPRKQPGTRGPQASTKGPVRPPMWLSKAELTQEIQRLGTLCEARTKELNRLKMETKHVSVGFDAFASLFKYMVEDLNALSVPALSEDLRKTLKQLELTKQDLAYYEREVEEMKSHHCQELNDLSNKLFEVYHSEVAELNAKHQEEVDHLKNDHQKQIEHLTVSFDASSTETKSHHENMVTSLEQEIVNQREELQLFQEREIRDLEEKHAESTKMLQDHVEQLQKKCAELKQHSMSMEDAMRKDTDSKLQWVSAAKLDLEKEVESLKAVLEMKNKELHTIRVQNLEMEKQLEELPFAREKIKMLQARAEDLEALMVEKTKLERKLSTENQQIKDTFERETKVNRRLSMENEELLWRLRQAENSLISGSFSEVPEFPEAEENCATSPTKSPGPQIMSRSVFFTFVDKDESSSHSPRSQYKKITPGFSANYKTSPAKSSKSPPAPSPRRAKSHSEPAQPIAATSTPRKVAKQVPSKMKCPQKRQRSGSDSSRPTEHAEVSFSSVTESMASSVSSECSVFEHRERLLEEHREHIIHSLEILREQRSTESSVDEPTVMEKKWCSDDIKIVGELSHLETGDMSRSAEFADPKTYYHMTFPVLRESGIPDCDMEDGCKNSSSSNSPLKEIATTMHSMSENNLNSAIEASGTWRVARASSHAEVSTTLAMVESAGTTLSAENVQREATNADKTDNRWRTI